MPDGMPADAARVDTIHKAIMPCPKDIEAPACGMLLGSEGRRAGCELRQPAPSWECAGRGSGCGHCLGDACWLLGAAKPLGSQQGWAPMSTLEKALLVLSSRSSGAAGAGTLHGANVRPIELHGAAAAGLAASSLHQCLLDGSEHGQLMAA
jgi:hypothetical protein